MYQALRQLKVIDQQNHVTLYKKGDLINDFDTWGIHAKRAHLSLEWVKKVEGTPPQEPSTLSSEKLPEIEVIIKNKEVLLVKEITPQSKNKRSRSRKKELVT